jgi:hypothetical protein
MLRCAAKKHNLSVIPAQAGISALTPEVCEQWRDSCLRRNDLLVVVFGAFVLILSRTMAKAIGYSA